MTMPSVPVGRTLTESGALGSDPHPMSVPIVGLISHIRPRWGRSGLMACHLPGGLDGRDHVPQIRRTTHPIASGEAKAGTAHAHGAGHSYVKWRSCGGFSTCRNSLHIAVGLSPRRSQAAEFAVDSDRGMEVAR